MEKNKLQHHNITTDTLFDDIRNIIEQGRQQAYAAANQITVLTYWHIGRRIVEEEQHGEARAQYGTRLIKTLKAFISSVSFASHLFFNSSNLQLISERADL